MKLKRMISALLVLCLVLPLTACMSAGTNPTETQTVPTTTIPVTTTTAPPPTTTMPKSTDCKLFAYETGVDTSVITEDTFVQLYQHAEYIIQNYETVSYTSDGYFEKFLLDTYKSWIGDELEQTKGRYTISINKVPSNYRNALRFTIMSALLVKEYAASCIYYNYQSVTKPGLKNDEASPWIVVTTDYKDYKDGYLKDYYDDIRRDPSISGPNTFVLYGLCYDNFAGLISHYKDFKANLYWPEKSNMVNEILAKAFPDE